MASLKVLEEHPSRLVLGKGGGAALGSLIGIIIFGVVACVGLISVFGEGGDFNPVMIVFLLVIGLVGLASFINSIVGTRVILDSNQKLATRTDSLLFLPTRNQALAFNLIRDVSVTSPGTPDALAFDSSPIWQVVLRGADGSSLVVNDRGTRSEMNLLGEQVGTLVGRPVKNGRTTTGQAAPAGTTYTAAGVMNSLAENLAAFAQSLGPAGAATIAPTVSAFPGDSPDSPYSKASARMTAEQAAAGASHVATEAQMAAERSAAFSSDVQTQLQMGGGQIAAGAPAVATNVQMAGERAAAFSSDVQRQLQMGGAQVAAGAPVAATSVQMAGERLAAFSSDVQVQGQLGAAQFVAGVPFTEASARLAQQQAQAQAAMGFSMPSLLTMPQMPPMLSMGPSLNMPSFAPMGVGFELMAAPLPVVQETKQVELQKVDKPAETGPLFAQARKLLGAGNYRDAEKAYLAALSTNPADGTAQNNLGVVYYAENKLRDAESAFRRAMALDPFNAEARYNLGLTLNRLGKRTEAQETFRVGAQTAGRSSSKHFQEALRGVLHDPLTSSG